MGDRNKQDLFLAYFTDPSSETYMDVRASAKKAGYSETTIYDIQRAFAGTKTPYKKIQAVAKQQAKELQKTDIASVLQKLNEVVSLFDKPEMLEKKRGKLSDILKALELIGKYLKMFSETQLNIAPVYINIVSETEQCQNCPYYKGVIDVEGREEIPSASSSGTVPEK